VHVCDLADAHVKALDRLLAGGTSASINLGTGRGHSIREIISAVEAISGRSVPAIAGPRRAGDPPALVADPRLGQRLLGWKPMISDLPGIVRTAWEWHEHRHSRRRVHQDQQHGGEDRSEETSRTRLRRQVKSSHGRQSGTSR
jgi:UDP-glucose 4-epimerase